VLRFSSIGHRHNAERLRFNISVPPEFGALAVPPFTLQTPIENSVKYAVAPRRAGGAIGVTARQENGAVKLEVRDDGPGFTAEAIAAGHGLDNLQARLAALFADQASLDIQADGQHVVDRTVAELEQELDRARFVRIHRAMLLNTDFIDEIHSWFGGRLRVRLKDDKRTELTVARDRVRELKDRLSF
jgi:hypothetical protein